MRLVIMGDETLYRRHNPKHIIRERKDRFYDSSKWRKLRRVFLDSHPLCTDPFGEHKKIGRPEAAVHIDHIIPRSVSQEQEFDADNLQALCHRCHSRKSILERKGM